MASVTSERPLFYDGTLSETPLLESFLERRGLNLTALQIQQHGAERCGPVGYRHLRDVANALGVGIPTERANRVAD